MPGLLNNNVLASILGAVRDPQFRADVRQGLLDAGNRGAVAGLLGGPVDLATAALRPFGYSVEKPVMGSEWIGQKMQDAGMVSPNRNALAEALASVALPAAAPMLGRGVYAAEQAAARNASIAGPSSGPMGKERGIFGGIGAKTADKQALERAQAMIQKGDAPADVWKQTGWAQGPDGKWRFEINDTQAAMRLEGPKFGNVNEPQLMGETVDHQSLYKAYPSLKKPYVSWNNEGGGSYNIVGKSMEGVSLPKGVGPAEQRSTALHELQHAVQRREGFAPGGSMEQFASGARINPATSQQFTIEEAMQAYQRLAGEAEARLVQSRMNMTPQQRLEQFPWSPDYFQNATGVPLNSLLLVR